MAWQRLRGKQRPRFGGNPSIKLWASGKVAWNKALDEALGHPACVELVYNEETQQLGLRATDNTTYGFTVTRTSSLCLITAIGALRDIGKLDTPRRPHSREAEADVDGIWAISLGDDNAIS